MCTMRCMGIYALGVLDQTKVALAKSDTMNRELNKVYRFL